MNLEQLPPCPPLIADAIAKALDGKSSKANGGTIHEGERNDTLFRIGCAMRARGEKEPEILEELRRVNTPQCQPLLDDEEVRKVAASAARQPAGEPVAGDAESTPESGAPDPKQAAGDASEPSERVEVTHEAASPMSDVANAIRLARTYGDELRWTSGLGWLAWDGKRWARSETRAVGLASQLGRVVYQESAEASGKAADEEVGKRERESLGEKAEALAKWARESEKEPRVRAALSLARPLLELDEAKLDADPWILNVVNGVIDLRTGERREHRREDLLTRLAPVIYDPKARAEVWQKFLKRVLPDAEVRDFVQRAIGYSLTGLTTEQILLLLYGGGANGKTTFIETSLAVLGDYGIRTPTDTLLARRDNAIPNDVAQLRGARFAAAVETEEGRRLAEVRVKELTGGDTVSARFMRAEWFTFKPVCKVWLSTNHRPRVRGTDDAIWRRIRLVPFTVTVPEAERDGMLPERLRAELPGVLAWAVEGCLQWQKSGLQAPEAVQAATKDYRKAEDVLGAFLEDCCTVRAGLWVPAGKLYESYRAWTEKVGENAITKKAFGAALGERGFESGQEGHDRTRVWRGLGLAMKEANA